MASPKEETKNKVAQCTEDFLQRIHEEIGDRVVFEIRRRDTPTAFKLTIGFCDLQKDTMPIYRCFSIAMCEHSTPKENSQMIRLMADELQRRHQLSKIHSTHPDHPDRNPVDSNTGDVCIECQGKHDNHPAFSPPCIDTIAQFVETVLRHHTPADTTAVEYHASNHADQSKRFTLAAALPQDKTKVYIIHATDNPLSVVTRSDTVRDEIGKEVARRWNKWIAEVSPDFIRKQREFEQKKLEQQKQQASDAKNA